jgi:hypothetical protein
MKEFRNNEQLKALVQNKCNVQVKTKVLLYREQPFEGAEQQFVLQFDERVLYDPNFRRREYLVQFMNDLKKVLEKQTEVITERISKFFNMNHSEWVVSSGVRPESRPSPPASVSCPGVSAEKFDLRRLGRGLKKGRCVKRVTPADGPRSD